MKRTVALVAGLLSAGLLLSACGNKVVDVSLSTTILDHAIAPGTLTDDDGKPFELKTDTTKPLTLVFFGYTNCPDVCPTVLASIALGLAKLSKSEQEKVQLYFVTSDPKRDTPAVMKSYLEHFDPRFDGLTGDLGTIATIGKSMGIYIDQGQKLASGGYDPNSHSTYVIGIGKDHRADVVWDGETAPSQFAHDFKFLLEHGTDHLESAQG